MLDSGLMLHLGAFNSQLENYVRRVMERLTTVRYYDATAAQLQTELEAAEMAPAIEKVREAIDRLVMSGTYLPAEMKNHLQNATQAQFLQFVGRLLGNSAFESLIFGNIDQRDADKVAKALQAHREKTQKVDTVLSTFSFKEGSFAYQFSSGTNNNAIGNMYWLGSATPNTMAIALVLENLLSDATYDELRNRQQLGYIVFAYMDPRLGQVSLVIAIQGNSYAPDVLDERISTFLSDYRDTVWFMDDSSFKNVQHSVTEALLTPEGRAAERRLALWRHVLYADYDFGDKAKIASEIMALSKAELVDALDTMVEDPSVLSVQAFAGDIDTSPRTKVSDLDYFRPKH